MTNTHISVEKFNKVVQAIQNNIKEQSDIRKELDDIFLQLQRYNTSKQMEKLRPLYFTSLSNQLSPNRSRKTANELELFGNNDSGNQGDDNNTGSNQGGNESLNKCKSIKNSFLK